jgi:hypothetical protein
VEGNGERFCQRGRTKIKAFAYPVQLVLMALHVLGEATVRRATREGDVLAK